MPSVPPLDEDALPEMASPSVGGSHPPGWVSSVFRPVRLTKLALLVGVVTLLPYAVQKLPDLASRPEYRVATREIRIVPAPERPVPANLLQQVSEQSQLPRDLSLLDNNLLPELTKAFEKHPWIAQVVSVRKSYPSAVTVEVRYRHPVGMVQVPGGRIPVDTMGFVLPSEDFDPSVLKQYPTIGGIKPTGTIRPGAVWRNPSLSAATRLAELLVPKWSSLQLEAIVVPSHVESATAASKIVLELRTLSGSRIIWGRAPGTTHPGELAPSQKLGRLEKYLSEFGGFDKPNGPYEIDIRHWQEISRRPLSAAPTISRGNSKPRR